MKFYLHQLARGERRCRANRERPKKRAAAVCFGSVAEKSARRAQPSLNGAQPSAPSTKSERAESDCAAPMGRGATATMERLAASLGPWATGGGRSALCLRSRHSQRSLLLALPALLVSGLLRHAAKYVRLPAGFYGLTSIFLLLAFMALGRLRSIGLSLLSRICATDRRSQPLRWAWLRFADLRVRLIVPAET
jgi:hypothetical protein